MMIELHRVAIGQQIRGLSMIVGNGQLVSIRGPKGSGKTMLLRAILGFVAVDDGYISIDGELLTTLSAPYFRRQMAYVPQHLEVPEGYTEVPTDYLELLRRAVDSGKPLLIIDEPSARPTEELMAEAERLLQQALTRGATVLAVNVRNAGSEVLL